MTKIYCIAILYTRGPIVREYDDASKAWEWFNLNCESAHPVIITGISNGMIMDKWNDAYSKMLKDL